MRDDGLEVLVLNGVRPTLDERPDFSLGIRLGRDGAVGCATSSWDRRHVPLEFPEAFVPAFYVAVALRRSVEACLRERHLGPAVHVGESHRDVRHRSDVAMVIFLGESKSQPLWRDDLVKLSVLGVRAATFATIFDSPSASWTDLQLTEGDRADIRSEPRAELGGIDPLPKDKFSRERQKDGRG
jgi:hypothetical protein